MFERFENDFTRDFSFLKKAKLLLAISGGVDSVVLAYLLKKMELNFALAHCNFNLRGEESDADESFVLALAEELDVEVFVENFDTQRYAEDQKLSIQMAARELRYNWFFELKNTLNFGYILTAHHANDDLETFLINFTRGTGLNGLTGIPQQQNAVIRPLLPFTRDEIEDFANQNAIKWREDSSNSSPKYFRNKLRQEVVPKLQELNPQLLYTFKQTQQNLQQAASLLEDYTTILFNKIVRQEAGLYFFNIEKLLETPNTKAVLYQLLKDFGFTAWDDVYGLLTAQTGKIVYSEKFRLIKDRENLILDTIPSEENSEFLISEEENERETPFGKLLIEEVHKIGNTAENITYFDKEKLVFPLQLRKWKEGDFFHPFGMNGKKKLSDFFANKKLSLPQKENVWLLLSEDKIIWVVNYRADDRFKVDTNTRTILKITCL